MAVIPARRVQPLAAKVAQPRDIGPAQLAQRACTADKEACLQLISAIGREMPAPCGFLESCCCHAGCQAHVSQQPMAFSHFLHVSLYLRRLGKALFPVRVGCEREGIHRGGHVNLGTRIGVVPPGSAQARLFLQDHEVTDACALELDGHAQPRHASAQNHHLVARRTGARGCCQRAHHKAGHASNGLIGAAHRSGVALEYMPAVRGDFAAYVNFNRLQCLIQPDCLTVQQFIGASLYQGRWQATQIGVNG